MSISRKAATTSQAEVSDSFTAPGALAFCTGMLNRMFFKAHNRTIQVHQRAAAARCMHRSSSNMFFKAPGARLQISGNVSQPFGDKSNT